jgi:hypothetical protein
VVAPSQTMRALHKRTWLNLALLGVAGALVLGIVLTRQAQRDTPFITALDPDSIQEITVSRVGQADILLRRGEAGWVVSGPISAPADPARVRVLQGLAMKPHYGAYPAQDLDLAQYGLDPPLSTIWLGDLAIAVGGLNPVNRRRYLMIADTVYLVTDTLHDPFTADVGSYVDHHLLPRGAHLVGLQTTDLRIRRTAQGHWQADGGQIDAQRAQRLDEAWRRALALQVQVMEEALPADADPVTLELDTGHALRYGVLSRSPQLVLAREGLRYLLPPGADAQLLSLADNPAP